ncbi:MAG: pre-peptidase C-terminal domain-containing protein, partial [Caldilineaceae bacterium]|nr:pre-peptidase C-terminal domain-containing protein [Caldilineaceae bacterium]
SREQRAESREQRAESREHGAQASLISSGLRPVDPAAGRSGRTPSPIRSRPFATALAPLLIALVGALPATAQSPKAIQAVEQSVFSLPPRPKAATPITSGTPFSFRVGPVQSPTIFTGNGSLQLEVPADATRVTVTLESENPSIDVDLFVRYGRDNDLQNGRVVSDYSSTGSTGNEEIVITPSSSPPLRAGTYFVSIALVDTGVVARGTITAEVELEPDGGGDNGKAMSRIHVFPQIADGGGWQSVFLVTNVSESDSACTLRLQGLSVDRFPRVSGVSASGSTATFTLKGGGYLVYRSTNQQALAAGYATLDCAEPVEAQVLYVAKDASGTTTGMATVFSSPAGTIFQFPVLALENRLAAAVANDTSTEASCRLVLEDHDRVTEGEATFSVPAKSTVARFLDQVIALPGGSFTSGSATLSCDQQVSVIGLYVDGSLFTTLPPAILSRAPDTTVVPPPPPPTAPDLVVTFDVSDRTPSAGDTVELRATVRNRGDGRSAATTLRYYRSSNATISASDFEWSTDAVSSLAPSETSRELGLLRVGPNSDYYWGACVDSVSGESNTRNNCSSGVRVTVSDGGGGGGGGRAGECVEGKTYGIGEGCDVYGINSNSKQRFTVLSDGRGRWGFLTSGNSISNRGGSINGVRYHFVASHQGGGVWKVDEYRP